MFKNTAALASLGTLIALALCISGCDSQAATTPAAQAAARATSAASSAADIVVEPSFDVAPAKPVGTSPESHTG